MAFVPIDINQIKLDPPEQDFLTQLAPDQPKGGYVPVDINKIKLDQQPQVSTGMDVAKTVGSNLAEGALSIPLAFGNMGNAAIQGPQMLYRGIRDTFQGNPTDNSPLYSPFYGSGDAAKDLGVDYQPKTIAGMAAAIPAQLAGAMLGGKTLNVVAPKALDFLQSETSGGKISQPKQLPSELQPLENLPDAVKNTMFAKKPNALESGLNANRAISEQYGKDVEAQQVLYKDLNDVGSQIGIKTPELYSKLDDLTAYLDNKVAVDSPEYKALTELKEIRDNLNQKYSTPSEGNGYFTPKEGNGITVSDGIQPSDLVEIKTVLNSGLKPGKFTTAGSGKILMFKKYVQDALQQASEASPEFGDALIAAEKQAARNGIYKSPELRTMWSPEDYVAHKANINNPEQPGYTDSTITRANMLLQNLNNPRAGRASVIARILGPDQSQQIFKDAILNAKATQPSVMRGIAQLPLHPVQGAKTIGSALIAPNREPLADLAKQIKRAKK